VQGFVVRRRGPFAVLVKGDDVNLQSIIQRRSSRRLGAGSALCVGASLLLTACPVEVPTDPGTTTTSTSTTTTSTTTTAPPLPTCEVPEAPVLSIISDLETLPFTIVGGGPIEVATLTAGQEPVDAVWTTTSSLPLAPYSGDTRVIARSASTSCVPTEIFDATYDVRPLYAGLSGTPDSPALAGTSPAFVGWATGSTDYVVGADVTPTYQTPANAVGPYGTDVVVLGNAGSITMTFLEHPITNGAGDDLAVFENGFVSGSTLFAELAYVEVSSNGVDFVRFDSASRQAAPIGGFALQSPTLLGGLAGKDSSGYGTPFDLTTLDNKALVRSGSVDLDAIRYVRIKDIVGAPDYPNVGDRYPDSFGRDVYDAHKTTGSGGFDLRAVGALHQG